MRKDDLFDDVLGGRELPKHLIRDDVIEPDALIISSELDRKMARLLTLHPQLRIKFRNNNLASLDDLTKEALLQDMCDVLGIVPLRND